MSKTARLLLILLAVIGSTACGGASHQVDACHVRDVICEGCAAACAATETHCHPAEE